MNPTPAFLRRRGLLATGVLAALLNVAAVPAALADSPLLRVEVLDRGSGEALRVWHDHGHPVVAGRPGSRYAVRLVNDSGERVLAVVAIDGINVVSGETAGVGQSGYVLGPWQRTEITGWRKSEAEVAAFEFTALADSYAARTGRPLDVGMIGVAVFREAPRPVVIESSPERRLPPPWLGFSGTARPSASADAATAAAAPPTSESRRAAESPRALGGLAEPASADRLGTGHGPRETSVARATTFERASSRPDQRVEIRYDSLDNLVAAGIVPPPHVASTGPRAFPADPPREFVPDPPRR